MNMQFGDYNGNRSETPEAVDGMSFSDIDEAVHAVTARIAEPPLSFDANFENGCLDRVVLLGTDWYNIILRQDTWYRFYFRVKGCAKREVIFDFTCRNINNPTYDEGKGRWIKSGSIVKPVCSYDRKQWQPVDFMKKLNLYPGNYRFRHTFDGNEAFLSIITHIRTRTCWNG